MEQDGVVLDFDERSDVLYVKRREARFECSRYAETDNLLVLSVDAQGEVIGFHLEGALKLSPEAWSLHADRGAIPGDLLRLADRWFQERWELERSAIGR